LAQRQEIFQGFWRTGQKQLQWSYVAYHVINRPAVIHRANSKRLVTKHYFLSSPSSDVKDTLTRIRVCQHFFLATLDISTKTVQTAQAKFARSNATISPDHRGAYGRPQSPKTLEMRATVLEHINLFPKVPAHYCRAKNTKMYLDGQLSVAIMHGLYEDWVLAGKPKASLRQYRDLFNELNISFHQPKKDQCNVCCSYNGIPLENRSPEQEQAQNLHLSNRNVSRQIKNDAKVAAQQDVHKVALCFDFQKILSAPAGEASMLYYKRKVSIYNFTVFEMGDSIGTCFVWDETIAGRGCNEVGSCLMNRMEGHVAKGVTEFALFSDNCAGQNRNRFVFGAYAFFARKFGVTIEHTFLEAGHTQN
jgi:hypothetical protein